MGWTLCLCAEYICSLKPLLGTSVQSNTIQYTSFHEAYTFSVFVDIVRKVIVLLCVYYCSYSVCWCFTGVHYVEKCS